MLRNADRGGVSIFRKNRYEGVRFNIISVTRGWVGVRFPEKKRYVTLEWPLNSQSVNNCRLVLLEASLFSQFNKDNVFHG